MAQDQLVPILFCRFQDDFGELSWSMLLSGPYEVTNPLQAMVMEAGSKGMSVVINTSLVPTETLFPEPDELEDETPSDEEE